MRALDKMKLGGSVIVLVFGLLFSSCMPGYEPVGEVDLLFLGEGEIPAKLLSDNNISGETTNDYMIKMKLESLTLFPSDSTLPEVKIDLYDALLKFKDLTKFDPGPLIVPVGVYGSMRLDIASVSVGSARSNGKESSDRGDIGLEIAPGAMPTANLNNFVVQEAGILEGDLVIDVAGNAFTQDAGDWFVRPTITVTAVYVPVN